ncbi:unnamed protein product [Ixodes pacificus]
MATEGTTMKVDHQAPETVETLTREIEQLKARLEEERKKLNDVAHAAQTSAAKKSKGPRVLWGIQETWALIAIWEDRLDDLRRAKRNARVYADISARLRLQGYDRDVEQVHHKIENLASTYRKHQRNSTTTGSSGINWPFYWELHRFLGSLPLNNTSLVVESSCSDQASPAMLEQVSKTRGEAPAEHDALSECTADAQTADGGVQDDGAVASTSTAAGSDSQQSSTSGDSTTGPRRDSAGSGGNTESSDSRSEVQPRRKKRKRSPTPNAALLRAVIDEQVQLRLSFEASRQREYELRERELALQREAVRSQQELATAMMAFLNKISR